MSYRTVEVELAEAPFEGWKATMKAEGISARVFIELASGSVGNESSGTPPSLRLDAQRLAAGRSLVPHPYIAAHLIGREFGIPPHEVLDWDAGDFNRTLILMNDLQPKER